MHNYLKGNDTNNIQISRNIMLHQHNTLVFVTGKKVTAAQMQLIS
jgi:hypothetical protein